MLLFPVLVVTLLLGVALNLGLTPAQALWHSVRSGSWPTVEGRVTQSWVQKLEDSEGKITWEPRVIYTYTVDNRAYEGNWLQFGSSRYGTSQTAEERLQNYELGRGITVHYDPSNPGNSVLEKHLGNSVWFFFILGSAFFLPLVFGVVFLIWKMFNRMRQRFALQRRAAGRS
ncbi:MAG: hypothetical protein OHK0046_28810 [Anaerolineae bacterium]